MAAAEQLPFGDGEFDASLAQLAVHFMAEPLEGLAEMARVTRRGGVVAACVWDHAHGGGPLARFWEAARELDSGVEDESLLAGTRQGHLAELLREAGLRTSRRARSRSGSHTRASTSGGSRSRSASAPPGRISRRSSRSTRPACASVARRRSLRGGSSSAPAPGPPAAGARSRRGSGSPSWR